MLKCLYINNKPFKSKNKLAVKYNKYRVVKRFKVPFRRDTLKTTLTTISLTATHVDIHDEDIINITKKILDIKQAEHYECLILQNKKNNKYLIQLNYTDKKYQNRVVSKDENVYWNTKTNKRIKNYKYRSNLKHHIKLNVGDEIPNSETYIRVINNNDLSTLIKQTKLITKMINDYITSGIYLDCYSWQQQGFKHKVKFKDKWGFIDKIKKLANDNALKHNRKLSKKIKNKYSDINDLVHNSLSDINDKNGYWRYSNLRFALINTENTMIQRQFI